MRTVSAHRKVLSSAPHAAAFTLHMLKRHMHMQFHTRADNGTNTLQRATAGDSCRLLTEQ